MSEAPVEVAVEVAVEETPVEESPAEVGSSNINTEAVTAESNSKTEVAEVFKTEETTENGAAGENKTDSEDKPKKSYPNNSKYDPSVLPVTDDAKKIRAQVEFYFGDANLPTDNFMWESTDGSANLPIPVETICSFGRMKRFQPVSAVVAALKESEFLEVIGEEGQEKVRRTIAYDPSNTKFRPLSRSVYVKGFGEEEPSSQFDIEAFFAPYGPTNAVRLRRTDDKLFKGSVFVEFQDDETAQKFLALEPKPLWKGKEELLIMSKKAYTDQKEQDIKDGKLEPRETRSQFRGRGRGRGGRGRGRGGNDKRGDRDPDNWKKRREDDRANGFKDQRHGRGGRGRGGRNNDRNRERDEKKADNTEGENTDTKPAENDKKRAREDDGEPEVPAKKVDTKPEVATEAS